MKTISPIKIKSVERISKQDIGVTQIRLISSHPDSGLVNTTGEEVKK